MIQLTAMLKGEQHDENTMSLYSKNEDSFKLKPPAPLPRPLHFDTETDIIRKVSPSSVSSLLHVIHK